MKDYKPIDSGECQMKCDRKVLMAKEGPIIVCDGCKRIIINKNK